MKEKQDQINDLMIDFPLVHSKIADVACRLQRGHYTYEEAKELMFGELDALDDQEEVLQNSIMWDEIRELQNAIINRLSSKENLSLNNDKHE